MTVRIIQGDCREVLPTLAPDSVHSIVTDPPYHLKHRGGAPTGRGDGTPFSRARAGATSRGFMGREWDGGDVAFDVAMWRECWRILKPGGYLLAFGGTRTCHRLACAIEDAGFEIRDRIRFECEPETKYGALWASLDETQRGALLELLNDQVGLGSELAWMYGSGFPKSKNLKGEWKGWGSALKPAYEPIIVARKASAENLYDNLSLHGCGALNINGCRVPVRDADYARNCSGDRGHAENRDRDMNFKMTCGKASPLGRWPANVIHDGSEAVVTSFPRAAGARSPVRGVEASRPTKNTFGSFGRIAASAPIRDDVGSAARFFYSAKASPADRNVGGENPHETVKPTALMRYLVRLVTPPGGTTLDQFAGSGSTGHAADIEGFDAILIENDPKNVALCKRRVRGDMPLFSEAV